jgi:hypothetical protein
LIPIWIRLSILTYSDSNPESLENILTFSYRSASPYLRHRCHNIQYFGQCIKIFGKKFSLASLLVEMVPDPAKKKPEYLFKIFENTTLC